MTGGRKGAWDKDEDIKAHSRENARPVIRVDAMAVAGSNERVTRVVKDGSKSSSASQGVSENERR
jgi:hypothetical protein